MILRRSYKFSLDIIAFIGKLPKDNSMYEVISKQLLRSGTSVGANIIEAQASISRKDFSNFISYALKSANETKYWLGLLKDSGKVSGTMMDCLLAEIAELANMLGSSMIKLKLRNNLKT